MWGCKIRPWSAEGPRDKLKTLLETPRPSTDPDLRDLQSYIKLCFDF